MTKIARAIGTTGARRLRTSEAEKASAAGMLCTRSPSKPDSATISAR